MSDSAQWILGISLGVVVVLIAAAIVITIVMLAMRIAKQARTAEADAEDPLGRIGHRAITSAWVARASAARRGGACDL